jgi:hypothetical protein
MKHEDHGVVAGLEPAIEQWHQQRAVCQLARLNQAIKR